MGFDVFGPLRSVCVSNVDGPGPLFDVFSLPRFLGLGCPRLEELNRRYYDSTTLRFDRGQIGGIRDELAQLQQAYRAQREPELMREHGVRARSLAIRSAIAEKLLHQDPAFHALEEFRLLCEEAIAAGVDVRCEGD
jgi:hypothetical protein